MKSFDINRLEGNDKQPSNPPPDSSEDQVTDLDFPPTDLAAKITPENFSEWYREREYESNIRDGKHYFNGPGKVKPATDHSPSSLLQCHRKIAYRQLNAPEEQADPLGIFWSGTLFEEELIQPYLEDLYKGRDTYVRNSIWVNFTLEHGNQSLRVKGVTDPVITDREGEPLLVTEIKSKRSIDNLDEPNRHHNAQAHCYMHGLSTKYDRQITDAVILYGSRTSLEIKPFHVQFDAEFWEDEVVDWIQTHSRYRMFGILPPASPQLGWECRYCSFKNRCGESDKLYNDVGPYGLLPKFADYPEQKLREYLESHPGAKLTPTLAYTYPELPEEYDTYDWECAGCDETIEWDQVEYDSSEPNGPECPICQSRSLRGPDPSDQQPIPGGADDG